MHSKSVARVSIQPVLSSRTALDRRTRLIRDPESSPQKLFMVMPLDSGSRTFWPKAARTCLGRNDKPAVNGYRSLAMTAVFVLALFLGLTTAWGQFQTVDSVSRVIKNFGAPQEGIYRGAQPDERGLRALKDLGVKTVVDFRNEPRLVQNEKKIVDSLDMNFISIPWDGKTAPRREDVEFFISLLKDAKSRPVFFHCARGAERTGVMWASYRVAVEGWDPDKAHKEMKAYDFRSFWFPHLRKFLYDFSKDYGFKKEYTANAFTKVKEWFLTHCVYAPLLRRVESE